MNAALLTATCRKLKSPKNKNKTFFLFFSGSTKIFVFLPNKLLHKTQLQNMIHWLIKQHAYQILKNWNDKLKVRFYPIFYFSDCLTLQPPLSFLTLCCICWNSSQNPSYQPFLCYFIWRSLVDEAALAGHLLLKKKNNVFLEFNL